MPVLRLSSRCARVLVCLLVAGVLTSLALVLVHSHVGGNYRPDCPACHQERAIGSSSGPIAVVLLLPSTADLGRAQGFVALGSRQTPAVHQTAPRSPPASAIA